MPIRRLRLVNVCQFRDVSFDWHPGLNGLLGPNGSGKSNILKSIEYFFTGTFHNDGNQDENVRRGADGPSFVELEMTHNGIDISGTRYLAGGGNKGTRLRIGGSEVFGHTACTRALLETIGKDPELLHNYVFVGDDALTRFIQVTGKARATLYARLFGTAEAEPLWELASKEVARSRSTFVPARLEEVSAERAAAEAEFDELVRELDGYAEDEEHIETCRQLIEHHQAWHSARDAARRHDELLEEVERCREEKTYATEQVRMYQNAHTVALENQVGEPITLASAVAVRRRVIEEFDRSGAATCPTCSGPVDALVETYRRELPAMESDLQAARQSRETFRVILEKARDNMIAANQTYERASADLVRAERALAQHRCPDVVESDLTEEEYQAALELQRNLQARRLERGRLEGRIQGCRTRIRAFDEALEKLRKEADQDAVLRGWSGLMNEIAEAVHRNSLPRQVVEQNLREMEADVNAMLLAFGVNFRVSTAEDTSYTVHFADGSERATRLSKGQKSVFALAFRAATTMRFAGDLGLLTLDEPTDGLDQENFQCVKVAIERLRSVSAAQGLQCILITHDDRLRGLFDHTIDLGTS